MIYIGIDPGKKGACAFILNNTVIRTVYTPMFDKKYNVSGMVNCLMQPEIINNGVKDCFCVIESVHSMPGQGCVSVFSFGFGYGLWVGIINALGIPYQLVSPQTWKKALLSDTKKDKTASIVLAQQLFPDFKAKYKKDEALAEALLIAEYGRRLKQ